MLACFRSLALVKIHGLGSVDHVGIQATPKCCDAVLEADGGLMEMGKGAGSWPIETMWGTHGNPISAGRLLLELMHPQAPTSSEKQRKDVTRIELFKICRDVQGNWRRLHGQIAVAMNKRRENMDQGAQQHLSSRPFSFATQ